MEGRSRSASMGLDTHNIRALNLLRRRLGGFVEKNSAPLREERGRVSSDRADQYPKISVRLFDVPKPPAAGRTNACKSNATPQSAGMFGKPIGSESAPDAS